MKISVYMKRFSKYPSRKNYNWKYFIISLVNKFYFFIIHYCCRSRQASELIHRHLLKKSTEGF